MRSNELASLAGITVRTLRHYHQIGLLDEPRRSSNGYRDYTVKDLATVLRIVSFTDLGVPLAQVRAVLGDDDAATALLERIDGQAAAEIDRLHARRRTIADLKVAGVAPDLPADLAPYMSMLRSRRSDGVEAHLREQLALIRHFAGGGELPWLASAMQRLSSAAGRYVDAIERLEALPDDAEPGVEQQLVDDLVDVLRSAVVEGEVPTLDPAASALILEHQRQHDREAQRRAWAKVLDALGAPGGH